MPATGNELATRNGNAPPATAAPTPFKKLHGFLESAKAQLQLAAAAHITPERMIRLALTAASRNPKLFQCRFETVGLSLLIASALDIEPDGWHGHLVPYWNSKASGFDCQFIPDYKGFIRLMYQNQRTLSVQTKAVYANDSFEFEHGLNEKLIHKPVLVDRGDLMCAWAMVKLRDAEPIFEVMTGEDIEKRRNASQSGRDNRKGDKADRKGASGPWVEWREMMWMKSVVKLVAKRAPLGEQVSKAIDYDSKIDAGAIITSIHDVDAVADGSLPQPDATAEPAQLTTDADFSLGEGK